MNVKLIKLNNRELIIGDIKTKDELSIGIENALLLVVDRFDSNGSYYLGDYIPMSENNNVFIYYKDIIAIVPPNEQLLDMWKLMVSGAPIKKNNIKLH